MSPGLEIVLRTVISFVLILVIARWIGRRTVAQLRFQDFITATMLGTLAGNLAFNLKIGGRFIALSMIALAAASFLLLLVEMYSRRARDIVEGKPVTVIRNGELLKETIRKYKFTEDSLDQQLRMNQVFDIKEVELAVLEKSGELSIRKKAEYRPLTVAAFQEAMNAYAPIELIVEGSLKVKALSVQGLSPEQLAKEAEMRGYRLQDIDYAVKGSDGRIHFSPRALSHSVKKT